MKLLDALIEAFLSIRASALRSALAVLGIAIGVGALIAVLAISAGTQRDIMRRIDSLGGNVLYVSPAKLEAPGVESRSGVLTLADGEAIANLVPFVEASAPMLRTSGHAVWRNENVQTNIHGTNNHYFVAREWRVAYGRTFLDAELERGAKVGLLGRSLVRTLFKNRAPESIIGEIVRVGNTPIEILGILEEKGLAPQGTDQDDRMIVPVRTMQMRLLASPGVDRTAVESLFIKVQPSSRIPYVQSRIKELLRARHSIRPGAQDDFTVLSLVEIQQAAGEASRALQFWLSVVASISLIVGGINIMNVMLVSVTERTREIGIRLAVGARSSDLVAQFLIEALAMSSIGGLVGISAGIGLAVLVGQSRSIPIDIDPLSILLAMLFALGVGALFSAYPAYRAGRQDPVLALKSE
jgi:putative ABC transport system permease protein